MHERPMTPAMGPLSARIAAKVRGADRRSDVDAASVGATAEIAADKGVWFAVTVGSVAALLLVPFANTDSVLHPWLWCFALGRVLAEVNAVRLEDGSAISMVNLFSLVAFAVLPPERAVAVVLISAILSALLRTKGWRSFVAGVGMEVGRFGTALSFALSVRAVELTHHNMHLALVVMAAYVGLSVFDYVIVPIGHRLRQGRAFHYLAWVGSSWRPRMLLAATELPTAFAACIAFKVAPWTIVAFGVPYLVVGYLDRRRHSLTLDLAARTNELALTNVQFATAMVRALDARDAYTAGHSTAVAAYARDIAAEVGCDPATCERAHIAGMLHDIGKIGIPNEILNKRGPLSDEEYELMKQHSLYGWEILSELDQYADLAQVVRHHHERWDGRGYPDHLSGLEIPMISRMILVADTYSAMTTNRPYRSGLDPEIGMQALRDGIGAQFDIVYAEAFLRVLGRETDAYRRGIVEGIDPETAHLRHSAKVIELRREWSGEDFEREAA